MSASPREESSIVPTLNSMPRRSAKAGVPAWQSGVALAGMALLLLLLAVRYVVFVQSRAMEFDQICTVLTAQAHSWKAYLAAVPVDAQPPFSHLAVRLGLLLTLPESIGIHLVSAFAMLLAVGCLFLLFQRRGAPLAGFSAAALLTASRGVEYMYTVRPYAALLAITALSLLVYDTYRTRRAHGIRGNLWPLALTVVLSATIHALALVYVLLPILAGEALYWFRARRFDTRLLLAVGLAATAFVSDVVLARQVQARYLNFVPMSARTPGLPTSAKLLEVIAIPVERRWEILLLVFVFVVALALWRWNSPANEVQTHSTTNDLEYLFVAAISIFSASAVAFAIGAANHYFFTRYASPAYLCGPLLLGVALASAGWRRLPGVQLAIAATLVLLPLPALRLFLKNRTQELPGAMNAQLFSYSEVVASPLAYPTIWWYATPQQRAHLLVLTDPERYRTLPDGVPEVVLQRFAAAGVLPFALTQYRQYHPGRDVYVITPTLSGDTWVPAALSQRGYRCNRDTDLHSDTYALTHCVRQ